MPSPVYEIEFEGDISELEYVFPRGVAASEGGKQRRFQEEKLLREIRSRGIRGFYVDGGAHVGNHTVFFAKYTQAIHVISIEAHPTIMEHLRRNVDRNGLNQHVTTMPFALWNEEKLGWMGPVVPNNAGRTQLGGDGRPFAKKRDCEVQCRTLDWILRNVPEVGVIKLDVEDCEVQAIQGAKEVLEKHRPLLIAEHHNETFFEKFAWEVEPLGYRPFKEKFDPRGETTIWEPS